MDSLRTGEPRKFSYQLWFLPPVLVLPLLLACWGFSVDDAWIIRRVVLHGLSGEGYSFHADRLTDAVTPLGFAQLIAALSWITSADPLFVARLSGAALLALSLVLVSVRIFRGVDTLRAFGARSLVWFLAAGGCLPLGAWASAGLATSLVTLLFTAGFLSCWPCPSRLAALGAVLLGMAAGLRPELFPAALTTLLVSFHTPVARASSAKTLGSACAFLLPILAVLVFRFALFGQLLPLSVVAKEPSLIHGVRYACGGALLVGPLWLCWGLLVSGQGSLVGRLLTVAPLIAHGAALALAGGDWMPLFRLWVPVLPAALCIGVPLAAQSVYRGLWAVPALLVNGALVWAFGSDAPLVVERRQELIERARPVLASARSVAAVDVGWLGAATTATIVDLGGVTDPRIARLPGGHTSKTISPGLFSDRNVDAWVVRAVDDDYRVGAPLSDLHAYYTVDARLLLRASDLGFVATARLPLAGMTGQYVVLSHHAVAGVGQAEEHSRHFLRLPPRRPPGGVELGGVSPGPTGSD